MRFVGFIFALSVVVAATIGNEMWFGRRAHRQAQERILAGAAERLERLPKAIGDWQMESESQLSQRVIDQLECSGHISRTYMNQRTGRSVHVAVLVGPAGPLIVHTPEICMAGRGNRIVARPMRVEIGCKDQPSQELYRTTVALGDGSGRRLQVYYGWSRGNRCEAPESPRWVLGREPALYKVQVAASVERSGSTQEQGDAAQQFLDDFLPILNGLNLLSPVNGRVTATGL